MLAGFQQQLSDDFQRTVERFLALQTMGTETARQDARALKKTVLALPMPEVDVLNGGLEILKTVDLRQPLQNVSMPFLRLYGYLDGLVPRKVVPMLDKLWYWRVVHFRQSGPCAVYFASGRVSSRAGGVEAEGVGGF